MRKLLGGHQGNWPVVPGETSRAGGRILQWGLPRRSDSCTAPRHLSAAEIRVAIRLPPSQHRGSFVGHTLALHLLGAVEASCTPSEWPVSSRRAAHRRSRTAAPHPCL